MIRNAVVSDSSRIAEIIVNSSRFAYKAFMNEELLYNKIQVDERIDAVKRWINGNHDYIYVYEDDKTKIVKGMMGIDKCFDEDKTNASELHILYVEPEFSREGIGSSLMQYFENISRKNGNKELVVWVLEENKIGRKFYEKNNFTCEGKTKMFERYNKKEIRYIKNLENTRVQ